MLWNLCYKLQNHTYRFQTLVFLMDAKIYIEIINEDNSQQQEQSPLSTSGSTSPVQKKN